MVPVDQYRLGLQRQYNPDASHHDPHPSFSLLPINLILLAASSGGATFPRPLSNHRNRCWPEYRRFPLAGKSRHLPFGRAMWTCWCKGRRRRNCREILKLEVCAERAFSGLRECLIRICHIYIHSGCQTPHCDYDMNIAPLDACPVDNVGKIPLAAPIPNPLYQVSSLATQNNSQQRLESLPCIW
jgi:hypothetical protein